MKKNCCDLISTGFFTKKLSFSLSDNIFLLFLHGIMKTELFLIGKTTDKNLQAGINDYTGRIGHYMPFSVTVIPELKNTKSLSEEQQKNDDCECCTLKEILNYRVYNKVDVVTLVHKFNELNIAVFLAEGYFPNHPPIDRKINSCYHNK